MKYRLVIFDSDGTLADSLPRMRELMGELADKHGFRKVEAHETEAFRELSGRAMLKELGIPLWKVPRLVAEMRALMRERIDEFKPFDNVDRMLRRLHSRGIALAVVSSNSAENVQRILGPDTARFITHYACGASMFGKASKLKSVLRATAIPSAEAIYIGDELRDGEAARKVGMAFGAVGWGQHRLDVLQRERPAEFFTTVDEIAAKLAE